MRKLILSVVIIGVLSIGLMGCVQEEKSAHNAGTHSIPIDKAHHSEPSLDVPKRFQPLE